MHPYLKEQISASEFTQSQVYNYEKHRFKIFQELIQAAIDFSFLYVYVYAQVWQ